MAIKILNTSAAFKSGIIYDWENGIALRMEIKDDEEGEEEE